jgi:hypothetical protein
MLAKTKTTTSTVKVPLARKAVLVHFHISGWSGRILDRAATEEFNNSKGAAADAGRYNKLLVEKNRLDLIWKLAGDARTCFYRHTRPWSDKGPRILPNALFMKFANEFREVARLFNDEADALARDFPSFIEERKAKLKGLFKMEDYPSPQSLRAKFALEYKVMPFPDAADFRADLDEATLEELRGEILAATKNATETARAATFQQIAEVVERMVDRLADPEDDDESERTHKVFRDSLVGNVRELVELLPAFNLEDDPRITKLIQRMEKELCVEDAKALRENDDVRATVHAAAESILADVSKFLA